MLTRREAMTRLGGAALLAGSQEVATARTIDFADLEYVRLTDKEAGFATLVPRGTEVSRPEGDDRTLSGGMLDGGRRWFSAFWEDRRVHVDQFDVGFDYYHVDWLAAHAERSDWDIQDLQTIENEAGLAGGRMVYVDPEAPGERRTAYAFIVRQFGYFIHGVDAVSDAFVELVAAAMESLVEEPWNHLDPMKAFRLDDLSFEIRRTYNTTETSKDDVSAKLVHNEEKVVGSKMLLVVKHAPSHDTSRLLDEFLGEVRRMGFVARVDERSRNSMSLGMFNRTRTLYRGYVTTGGDFSVGLIIPAATENPVAWLAGRKLYGDAVLALEDLG